MAVLLGSEATSELHTLTLELCLWPLQKAHRSDFAPAVSKS